ncbi:hypothetical protein TRQ7_05980 [Thermotoga sp. RQ7]|uniref:hypothetical protein n=1 Tax=Thermotoga sp. RQ7 TaxID=126738 RepID=UPI0005A3698A|nr:hypothetical protein [Thermotoga sp. RQ7]AJG41000.1 hypothetical protein TRQ7_05980 [Thermotoga sp. RQ7]
MRSLIILSILSMTVMASPVLLLFEDSAILMEDVSVDKTMNITIPENWDVMDVLGAESWYVLPQEKLSWEDVMKGKVVEIVENPPERSELVSLSPLVFRKGKKYFLYSTTLEKWLAFDYEESKSERTLVLNGQGEVTILLRSSAGWNVQYYLFENLLIGNVFLSVSGVNRAEVFLVSRRLRETSTKEVFAISRAPSGETFEEYEAEEVKIYRLGEVENLNRSPVVEFLRTNLSDLEEFYEYEFSVSDRSFDFRKTTFTKKFKTTVDLPKGTVNIFSRVVGMNLIVGKTDIVDTPKNTPLEIPVTSSWDVRVKGDLLEEKEYKDFHERHWKVTIQNLGEKESRVRITVYGSEMTLQKTAVEPSKVTSDTIVFDLPVSGSSEKEIEFTVRSRW